MYCVSITNQKGGVGKTTTAIHLADALARYHQKKVIALDLDSQQNLTSVLTGGEINPGDEPLKSTFDLFQGDSITGEALLPTATEGLFVIPASLRLVEVENMLAGKMDGFFKLREALEGIQSEVDFVVIDCPPSLSMLTINSLVAADGIIVPMQVSKFSIDGIQTILDSVSTVKKRYNPHISLLGALFSMHNPRTTLAKAMRPEVEKHLPAFGVEIPRSVVVEEAHLLRQTLFDYAPEHKVTQSFAEFGKEALQKIEDGGVR